MISSPTVFYLDVAIEDRYGIFSSPSITFCLSVYRLFISICLALFAQIRKLQVLPSQFQSLLNQHQANIVVLRYGMRSWPVTVNNGWFEDGWDEYCRDNIVETHDMLMLRHTGRLIFVVLHFCEL